MANPYIGEIRMFGGNFAPLGWALCNGQLLPISQYTALYQVLSTTYGGDGQNTFALPDLQCRVPVNQGQGPGLGSYVIGAKGGVETVTLLASQLPVHTHQAVGNSASAGLTNPANATWGTNTTQSFAPGASANATMNSASVAMSGNGLPHDNMLPFLALTFPGIGVAGCRCSGCALQDSAAQVPPLRCGNVVTGTGGWPVSATTRGCDVSHSQGGRSPVYPL